MHRPPGLTIACAGLFAALAIAVIPRSGHAEPGWLGDFQSLYPTATRLGTCGVCHRNFSRYGTLNPYGQDFKSAGGKNNQTAALNAIASDDSDGDGSSNVDEITTAAGFMPGYTCETYTDTVDAPADLAFYVDPNDVGCGTATTTTTSTSSTTLAGAGRCSMPVSSGESPLTTDCLVILQAAVSLYTCSPECICAPKGSLPTTATDTLLCLQKALGQQVVLDCPCGGGPSTTTTSTTLAGSTDAGRLLYDAHCAGCHRAGTYDAEGTFSDLAGDGDKVVTDLGTLDSFMDGLTLSDQEVADLSAFLDSLQ